MIGISCLDCAIQCENFKMQQWIFYWREDLRKKHSYKQETCDDLKPYETMTKQIKSARDSNIA